MLVPIFGDAAVNATMSRDQPVFLPEPPPASTSRDTVLKFDDTPDWIRLPAWA